MNITSLILENFGKFKKFECVFTPGINVIKGGNETGKTTLVSAIAAVFYGNPKVPDANMAHSASWSGDKHMVIKANIAGGDFSGTVEKDFGSGKATLANQLLNLSIDDSSRIVEIVSGAVGIPNAEIFQATVCVKQGEMTKIGNSIEAIKTKLEALVTGGIQDLAASEVIAKIDKRIESITANSTGMTGLLQKLEKSQGDIDYNIDKLRREISNLKTFRNSLAQVEMAHANTTEDYHSKKQVLDQYQSQEKALIELTEVGKLVDDITARLEKAKIAHKKIDEIKQKLGQIVDISPEDREQIEEIESTLKYLRPKLRELEKEVESATLEISESGLNHGLIGWAGISVAAFGFSIADYFLHITQFYFHLGGASLVSLMISAMLFSRALQKNSFLKEQLKVKSRKLTESQKEIDEQSGALRKLLARYRISSPDQIRQIVWKRDEFDSQLRLETEHLQSLLDGSTENNLDQQCKELRLKEGALKESVKTSQEQVYDQGEVERLKLIVGQLEEQKNTLANEILVFSRQLETAEGGAELLASYLERKEELSAQKFRLVDELTILSLTKESIELSRQNIMISTLELLENRTSQILDMMTGGKYNKVRFDKSSLKFEVYSEQKRGWVDPEQELSKATVEQIYLTARLALTEILAEKSKPPIILDNPFDNFDSQRLENTMKILKQMATDRQILLLTSDDRFDRYADNTVQL